jgi:hypothetical protein
MGKVNNYLVILIVTIILFHAGGLMSGGGSTYLLGNLGILNPENFRASTFVLTLLAIISASVTGGIFIGTITRSDPMSSAMLLSKTFVLDILIIIGWDLIALFLVLKDVNTTIAAIVFSPLIIVYVLSVYDWWRGRD